MTSDVKVWVPLKAGFVYPDATVVVGRAEAYPGTIDVLTNPSLRTYGPGSELRVKGPDAVLAVDELYRMAFEDDAG